MQNKSKRYAQTSLSLSTTSGVRPNVNESKAIMAYYFCPTTKESRKRTQTSTPTQDSHTHPHSYSLAI